MDLSGGVPSCCRRTEMFVFGQRRDPIGRHRRQRLCGFPYRPRGYGDAAAGRLHSVMSRIDVAALAETARRGNPAG